MPKVLIVDDDQESIELLSEFLSSFGHIPAFLVEPEYLFRKLKANPVDLILLDVNMPKVDGLTLLKQLKGHPEFQNIPVIMVTGRDEDDILSSCFREGAMDFISKPVRKMELEARVHTALNITSYTKLLADLNLSLEEKVKERTRELRESHDRFALVMDSLDSIVYVTDINSDEILFTNKYMQNIFGDTTGKTCWKVFQKNQSGPCDFCTNDKLLTKEGKPTGVYAWEFQNTTNGRWYDIHDQAIRWIDGRLVRLEIAIDISEKKKAEEAVRESERLLQSILDNSTAVVYMKDLHGKYLFINRQFATLFHTTKQKIVGRTDNDIFPREIAEAFVANDKKVEKIKNQIEFEETVPQDDGLHTYISIKFPLFDSDGNIYGICGLSTDITERKRAEDASKEYSKKLVASQEAERKRIAMELHDGLGQDLITIRDGIKRFASSLPERDKGVEKLERLSNLAIQSLEEVREISNNLRPHILDQLGLELALEAVIDKIAQSYGIKISFSLEELKGVFPKEQEIHAYRIVQEGLTNIAKHSKATKARVNIKNIGEELVIEISDNGKGFEIPSGPASVETGFGLDGMNERAKMLGGVFSIDSMPGKGTTLTIKTLNIKH